MSLPIRSAWLLAACVLLVAGCNIVGPAYLLVHGPPSIPPAYTLDASRTTALLIDDRRGVLPRPVLAQRIAEAIEGELLNRGLVDDLISARSTRMVTRQESHDKPMSLDEIARAVDAEVILSITIDEFTLSEDGQTFAPRAVVRAKVYDAARGERLWPEEPQGFVRIVRMPIQQGTPPTTRTELLQAQETLAQWTGLGVAQLFYKREVTDDKGRG